MPAAVNRDETREWAGRMSHASQKATRMSHKIQIVRDLFLYQSCKSCDLECEVLKEWKLVSFMEQKNYCQCMLMRKNGWPQKLYVFYALQAINVIYAQR